MGRDAPQKVCDFVPGAKVVQTDGKCPDGKERESFFDGRKKVIQHVV